MTEESRTLLLQAYRAAIAAGQDSIANMLEDVILGEMGDDEPPIAYRLPITVGNGVDRGFTNPTYQPPYKVTCTGIDTLGDMARPIDATRMEVD